MARPRQHFGPNLRKVLERAPLQPVRDLLAAPRYGSGSIVDPAVLQTGDGPEALADALAAVGQDVLKELEDICRRVLDLSEGKGRTSLNTVVEREMHNTDIVVYRQQPDEFCKSIWVYTHFPKVFLDAQSFHTARRYRDHGKLYSAFEVADDVSGLLNAETIDGEALAARVGEVLDLGSRTTVTAIDLPQTDAHPQSVMVAVRHGGPLSSIQDHRDDGLRETRYYRPAEEAILIYTPSLRRLEVCARSYVVRDKTSRAFAEVVLGQDLSRKPLTGRNFNLDRLGVSLQLPIPDFADVEVKQAKVTEIETRLGSWKRILRLQVTIDDDIEKLADQFMGPAKLAAARFGYSRIGIAVAYTYRETSETGTLKLTVSSGNTSNVQNDRDPKLRDLGLRLLSFWGMAEEQRLLGEEETARYFDGLLFLYDHPEDMVSASMLTAAGIDYRRLVSAKIIEKRGRQEIILIDDDDGPVEVDLDTGPAQGTLNLEGPFGEDLGATTSDDHLIFKINRGYLAEIVLGAVQRELGAARATLATDLIAEFGKVSVGSQIIPVYFVRALGHQSKPEHLDLEFRRRHLAGPGLVLCAGETGFRYLGSNVVVPIRQVVKLEGDDLVLDPEALEQAYRSGQSLMMAGDGPQIILHSAAQSTLLIPGKPPFNLFGEVQTRLFERLVDAWHSGRKDVPTGELMRGMGSKSPQQLFDKPSWSALRDTYLTQAVHHTWRLCVPEIPD